MINKNIFEDAYDISICLSIILKQFKHRLNVQKNVPTSYISFLLKTRKLILKCQKVNGNFILVGFYHWITSLLMLSLLYIIIIFDFIH